MCSKARKMVKMKFLLLFSSLITNVNSYGEKENDECNEGFFQVANEGATTSESNSLVVSSNVETKFNCGIQMMEEKRKGHNCTKFSFKNHSEQNEINCLVFGPDQLAQYNGSLLTEEWVTYHMTARRNICAELHPCQNGGQCIPIGSCYHCKCNIKSNGKNCENLNHDYDIVFSSGQETGDSYIRMNDVIKTDITEWTFTTWFKINEDGPSSLTLFSYFVDSTVGIEIVLYRTDAKTIGEVIIQISASKKYSVLGALDDGYWHHFGLTWKTDGSWNGIIDGTHYIQKSVGDLATSDIIPAGGDLVIGHKLRSTGVQDGSNFGGVISRLNFWDKQLGCSDIEKMAKSPGRETGNILSWPYLVDYIIGDLLLRRPSTAQNTNVGLDYELRMTDSQHGFVKKHGPQSVISNITVCVWIKIQQPVTFVSYYNEEHSLSFAVGVYQTTGLFLFFNGIVAKGDFSTAKFMNSRWQFVCTCWSSNLGKVVFHRSNYYQKEVASASLKTTLPAKGTFYAGYLNNTGIDYAWDFIGTMAFLNIWNLFLPLSSVRSMSGGGQNINGDLLAWRNVPNLINGEITRSLNTDVSFPSCSVITSRTDWCNINIVAPCGQTYARLGTNLEGLDMQWRCYCANSLVSSKFAYDKRGSGYYNRHIELTAIKN